MKNKNLRKENVAQAIRFIFYQFKLPFVFVWTSESTNKS